VQSLNNIGRLLVQLVCLLAGLGLTSGLAGCDRSDDLTAAFDAEFHSRPDGYRGLRERYGLEFPSPPLQMDPGVMYKACADGTVDVIDAFATDGRIPAYDLFVLKDDKGFFPPYYAAPLVRRDTLEEHPELRDILNRLAGTLDTETMRKLNYEVDEKGRKAVDVARDFLVEQKLIDQNAAKGDGSAGTIVVGGKQFTEQEILGQLMAILIEQHSNIRVRRKLNLGGTMICFTALKAGDLDLYAEYTGTGLVNILKADVIRNSDQAYQKVKQAFDEQYDLVWLEPFGFNNAYTLTMRKQQAEELDIKTISDLARFLDSETSQAN
jgi:osmoprotectant transport system permease protein